MAERERIAGGVYVEDAAGQLARRDGGWPRRHAHILRIYVHHSGKLGAPGLDGLVNSAAYSVRTGWPGTAYHYWIPFGHGMPEGPLLIFRAQPEDRHSWHTGGRCNGHGLSVCLQGNTTTRGLSRYQVECLEALLPWLREKHAATLADPWLSWHSESGQWGGSGKRSCPGREAEAWLQEYREAS